MSDRIAKSALVRFGISKLSLAERIRVAKSTKDQVPIPIETAEKLLAMIAEIEGRQMEAVG